MKAREVMVNMICQFKPEGSSEGCSENADQKLLRLSRRKERMKRLQSKTINGFIGPTFA
jgi:hypothetical protein